MRPVLKRLVHFRHRASSATLGAMPYGVTTLHQVAEHRTVLDVACIYCKRRGRLHTPQLIAQYGQTLSVAGLRRILAADCPKKHAQTLSGPCGVYLPGLSGNAGGRE